MVDWVFGKEEGTTIIDEEGSGAGGAFTKLME